MDQLPPTFENTTARVIKRTRRYEHTLLLSPHCPGLPCFLRIDLNFLLLDCFANSYTDDLLTPCTPARSLRSADQLLFSVPRERPESGGGRAFAVRAPEPWNNLSPASQASCLSVLTGIF